MIRRMLKNWWSGFRATAAAAVLGSTLFAVPASADLRAERISEANASELLIGGSDAVGGVDDWYLANDVVEIIVDDPSRTHAKQNFGGSIVDAGLRDRTGEDQFARFFTVMNLSPQVAPNYDRIRAEVDSAGNFARLVVSNSRGIAVVQRGSSVVSAFDPTLPSEEVARALRVETEYRVQPGESFVRVTTTFRNDGEVAAPIFAYADTWMRGGRSMRAFVGNTQDPTKSSGFDHLGFGGTSILDIGGTLEPFDFVVVPGMRDYPPIGYAMFSPERIERGLVHFGVTSEHINLINVFVTDPGWHEVGLATLFDATSIELAPGESWSYERWVLIVGHPDVASATDVIFERTGLADGRSGVRGTVTPASEPCAVHVATADGAPVTQILTRTTGPDAGRYRAILPPGDYRLTFRGPHREPFERDVTVGAGRFASVANVDLGGTGWLVFEQPFRDGGGGRVVVTGRDGTPPPTFEPELLDFTLDGALAESGSETHEIHFVGNESDPVRVPIAPGKYRLTATRGLLYGIDQLDIEVVTAGDAVAIRPFVVDRAVALDGFVSADMHVHAQASDDSGISNVARLRGYVAEHIDVMVSTDHDHIADFGPAIEELDVAEKIEVIIGVEVTSSTGSEAAPWTLGHHNAWPIEHRSNAHRQGAPPSQNLTLANLYALLRSDYGARVVQLNHPRPRSDDISEGAYFSHMATAGEAFDPNLPLTAPPNDTLLALATDGHTRAIDFDAIEIMNGNGAHLYHRVRDDWYALLRQGYLSTGTANSDTHGPSEIAAYPRNFVQLAAAAPFDPVAFDRAIRDGRVFGTTGPLIPEFRVSDAGSGGSTGGMGELVASKDGRVVVEFRVAAPDWVPVDEVRLVANGEVVHTWPLDAVAESDGTRFAHREELVLRGDVFLTLEAGAPLGVDRLAWIAEHPGPYTQAVAPGFVSAAFANPIFVDVDGNGRFDPPGPWPAEASPAWWLLIAVTGGLVLWGLQGRRPPTGSRSAQSPDRP